MLFSKHFTDLLNFAKKKNNNNNNMYESKVVLFEE